MNRSVKPDVMKVLVLAAGTLGLILRFVLYTTGTDPDGLLIPGHWAGILVWLVTALTLAGIVWVTHRFSGSTRFHEAFPASVPAGIGCGAAAVGILLVSIPGLTGSGDGIVLLTAAAGIAAAGALFLAGVCRVSGKQPGLVLYALICIFFALRLVCQYRRWSADPQLQNFLFHLCACVGLMLTAYHHTAFGAGLSSCRQLWMFSLITLYLCCLSLIGHPDWLFYLATGVWVFTGTPELAPRRRRHPSLRPGEDHTSDREE